MSDDISATLESYIYQEKSLLNQLSQIRGQRRDFRTELGKDAVSWGARELLGRTGGKYARKIMERATRERIEEQERQIDVQHRGNVQRIRGFLGSVSEWRKNLKEPNSDRLISKLDLAQSGARVATRIRHTITLLENLKSKKLVYNKELPLLQKDETVLPPGSPYQGLKELRKVLSSASGYVKVCDTYVSIKTLDILDSVPTDVPIKLLTDKTGGAKRAPAFLRACKDFKTEHLGFEVRRSEGLHDRFILMAKNGWAVGSSLNAFGSKFSAMTQLQDQGKREAEKIFNDLWKQARIIV